MRGDVDCWKIDDHLGEGYEDNGSYQFQCSATISGEGSHGVGSCRKEYSGACVGPGACKCTMNNFSVQKPSWDGQAKLKSKRIILIISKLRWSPIHWRIFLPYKYKPYK